MSGPQESQKVVALNRSNRPHDAIAYLAERIANDPKVRGVVMYIVADDGAYGPDVFGKVILMETSWCAQLLNQSVQHQLEHKEGRCSCQTYT